MDTKKLNLCLDIISEDVCLTTRPEGVYFDRFFVADGTLCLGMGWEGRLSIDRHKIIERAEEVVTLAETLRTIQTLKHL